MEPVLERRRNSSCALEGCSWNSIGQVRDLRKGREAGERQREREKAREREILVVLLIYAFISWLLCVPLTTDQTHRLDIWKQYSYQLSYPARAEVCSKHQGYSTPDFLSQDKTNGKKKTMILGNLFKMNFETNVEEEKAPVRPYLFCTLSQRTG